MKAVCTRVINTTSLQQEYTRLLENPDVLFVQVEVSVNAELLYIHLKGGRGRQPQNVIEHLVRMYGTLHAFEVRRLDYFYSDHLMRQMEVVK